MPHKERIIKREKAEGKRKMKMMIAGFANGCRRKES